MDLTLCPVDASNWYAVVSLCVDESQRGFVAANAFSLAQAAYTPDAYPLAVCADGEPVGFILYLSLIHI